MKAAPQVWAQGRIAAMIAKANPQERRPLEDEIARQWQEVGIGSFEERPQLCPPHLHRSWYRGGNLSQAMIEEREVHCDPGSFCHPRDLEEVVVRDSKFQINVQLPI